MAKTEKPRARRKPTLKQKRAVLNVVENGGNISKAMRDAGYSPATAKNPDKLTESPAWEQLLEEYFPDDKILRVLDEGLDAFEKAGNPDFSNRHRYADTVLKLKRKYPAEKHEHTLDEELKESMDKLSQLLPSIKHE